MVLARKRNERLARLGLNVGRIDNRQLRARQPPRGHEVQRREGVVGRRLVVLVVRHERAEAIRRHHLGRLEVLAGERRLAAPGRSDQDHQGELGNREGHRANTAICVGGPTVAVLIADGPICHAIAEPGGHVVRPALELRARPLEAVVLVPELSRRQRRPLHVVFGVRRRQRDSCWTRRLEQDALECTQPRLVEMLDDFDHRRRIESVEPSVAIHQ